ncbi:hypothetical protein M8312_03380 [Sphingomonas sp. KRR8]|uniref:hypothetical protein n=1 Tax=Sphingomonas sp. KRR8 TaxID=2942996 RepID=UPI0020211C06|nr:hypothetical protein [Sphingomonas sp. KRR8]URD61569.1 hypothetical protein M8312_03380 [Sphingomonas sp. KRR8]
MNKLFLTAAVAASVGLSGCATTDPYGYNRPYGNRSTASGALTGAAVGAATGAVVGAVVPGVSTGAGAIAGGIAGAVLGAVINGRQTYRTTTGRCFYTDQYGQVVYLPDNQC